MKVVVCIPARYASTRFPGKVLANETGKFLIQHVWERATASKKAQRVIIATDSDKVVTACKAFGAECVLTSESHESGTDRIAEAVSGIDADIVVNLQGDEPEMDPGQIDLLVELLEGDETAEMATLVTPFVSADDVANPNMVKVVVGEGGRAIYFSRSVIPYDRDNGGVGDTGQYLRHLGMYAYRKDFLGKLTKLPVGRLERIEKLEQLRVLENGYSILVGKVEHVCEGIDTAEQYAAFVERYKG